MKLFDRKLQYKMIVAELRREGETVTPERHAALKRLLRLRSIHVFHVFFMRVALPPITARKR